MDDPYLKILQMIQDGTISAEEGERLLEAMGEGAAAPAAPEQIAAPEARPADTADVEAVVSQPPPGPEQPYGAPGWWRSAWVYVLAGGVVLLAAGGVWTGWLARGNAGLGWLACTIPLLLCGTVVILLAWWARMARWLHIRVHDEDKNIRLSMPLPLRLTAWLLRLVRPWVPKLRETAVDELIMAVADEKVKGNILMVEVDDEDEGEEVRVIIG